MNGTSNRIWFYYAKEKQVGPISESELRGVIASSELSDLDYIYREGFADWKHLKDVPEFKKANVTVAKPPPALPERRVNSPMRAPINEQVVAHNDVHVASGHIKNISATGVFLETADNVFSLNDEVKLTLKEGKGLGKPMHLKGVVVRHTTEGKGGVKGYGLELRGLDESARTRIAEYIKRNEKVS